MAHTLAELRNSCFFAAATAVPLDTLSVSALGATSLVTLPGYGGRHRKAKDHLGGAIIGPSRTPS